MSGVASARLILVQGRLSRHGPHSPGDELAFDSLTPQPAQYKWKRELQTAYPNLPDYDDPRYTVTQWPIWATDRNHQFHNLKRLERRQQLNYSRDREPEIELVREKLAKLQQWLEHTPYSKISRIAVKPILKLRRRKKYFARPLVGAESTVDGNNQDERALLGA